MEFRIPRKEWKQQATGVRLPPSCVICFEPASKDGFGEIHYHPNGRVPADLMNFRLHVPLCLTHLVRYRKGQKYAKISMYCMAGGIIPFIIALVLFATQGDNIASIILFAIAVLASVFGFGLMGPSNTLLKDNCRGTMEIKMISGSEIIIDIKNKKLADFLKENYKVQQEEL